MEGIEIFAAAAQLPSIEVDKGGFLGNTTSAGLGIILFWASYRFASKNRGLWGPWVAGKLESWKWDWKSLASFGIGFFAITMILGSGDNLIRNLLFNLQFFFELLARTGVGEMFGAGGFCIILLVLAMWQEDDSLADLRYGAVAAILFPLGGGSFTQVSVSVGGAIANLINGAW